MVNKRTAYLFIQFLQVGGRNRFLLVQLHEARMVLAVDGIPIGRVCLPKHVVLVDSVPDCIKLFGQGLVGSKYAGLYHVVCLVAAGSQQRQ